MQRIDELTGLRALAITLVIAAHCGRFYPMSLPVMGDLGDTGVQIFFVLSGFLITTLLIREHDRNGKIDIPAFYRRRILRIAPAFYGYLAVLAVLVACRQLDIGWRQFVISGCYLWNYAHLLRIDKSFAAHPDGAWYLGHSWSLALEEQFYLLWPGLLLFIRRGDLAWAVPAAVLAIPLLRMTCYILEPGLRAQLGIMFHTGADPILAGSCVALYRDPLANHLRRWVNSKSVLTLCLFVILAVLPKLAAAFGGGWSVSYGPVLAASVMGLLLLCCLTQPGHWVCAVLRTRACLFIGGISYSLYLWQQLFSNPASPVFIGFPGDVVASVLVAWLSYRVIEQPFLRIKTRRYAGS